MSTPMLSLPVVAIANLTSPAELFRCVFYKTTLSAASCIARQGVRRTFRGGTAQGKNYQKEFVPKIYEYCASGKCMQGSDVRVALADYKPPGAKDRRSLPVMEQVAAKIASGELREREPIARPAEVIQPRAVETPAPEPESKEEGDVEEKHCKEEGCDKTLRSDNESGYCTRHSQIHYMRKQRAAKAQKQNGTAPPRRKILGCRARAAQRAAPDAPPSGSAPDDVEEILQRRLIYYRAQADRCERALKALRG